MFNSVKWSAMSLLALIATSISLVAYAQNTAPSFFGSGSQTSVPPKSATAARPSTTQVWSKDDFTKKTTELNSKREANFQSKLNASLKPMPAKSAAPAVTPAGGFNSSGGASAPATNPSVPPTSSTNAQPSSTATPATPSSGYTGFSSPPASKSPSQTNSSSGGWNVTY